MIMDKFLPLMRAGALVLALGMLLYLVPASLSLAITEMVVLKSFQKGSTEVDRSCLCFSFYLFISFY